MKEIAIMIGTDIPQVSKLANFMQAEGMEVICLQSEEDLSGLPDPRESPLILLAIPDEHMEEGYAQLLEWKKLYPFGNAMLLPLGSSENWETTVMQTRAIAKKVDFT